MSSTRRTTLPWLFLVAVGLGIAACGGASDSSPAPTTPEPMEEPGPAVSQASVVVDASLAVATIAPFAFGIHTSVYDNSLHDPSVPSLLAEAGITLLRYPGGGYSDNYHWSVHRLTPFADGSLGYLAPGSDFGNYLSVIDSVGTAMITVNYGSNLQGTGPGEPKEAAAWVAYANGDPDDDSVIGEDSTGNDWQTVGFWASLRASEPDGSGDGYDFLRVSHPEPLGIEYWEIGNEVFGNGYYPGNPYELDLHVPNDGTVRENHPALSPTTYGLGVRDYVEAMKAVDPSIRVGAVLNTPPNDYSWGPTWNTDVLSACGDVIDFVIVHLYTGRNAASLLRAPTRRVPEMASELENSIAELAGDNASNVEITLTEIGPRPGFADPYIAGIYAADVYVTLMEQGIVNIDWLELHNGSFLEEHTQVKGPVYHGLRMAKQLLSPGDTLVSASSTNDFDPEMLAAHAVRRQDGKLGLMLVNRAAETTFETAVEIAGTTLESQADRYDYVLAGTEGEAVGPTPADDIGNGFSISLPPHSVTVLTIPESSGLD